MKKIILFVASFLCIIGSYAQKSADDLVVAPQMYETFGKSTIAQYQQTNLAELIRLNYKMLNYACVVAKLTDENYQMLGNVSQYANKGVVTNEEEIIKTGFINPFLYSFPQDDYKVNFFPLQHKGYYIMVIPKYLFDARVQAQLQQYGL